MGAENDSENDPAMTILPIDPVANATPEALRGFLATCRTAAQRDGHAKLVSISIAVDALDPLAVLESIFEPDEPHFYAERVSLDTAIAGAEAVVATDAHGPERFAAAQRFIDETLAHTIAVGEVEAAFGGPHFFAAFAFENELAPGEPFPAARVFVPRWQVARAGSGTTAVANLLVTPDAPLELLAEKVWRAHGKFRTFEYAAPEPPTQTADARATLKVTDQGDYPAAVAQAIARIAAGEFSKIVLARTRTVQASEPLHPLQMLNQLRQRFPECHAFSIANGRGQSFIGATPERLARVSRGALETEALAGSAPRGASATEDARLGAELLRSDKDRREQRLVLDSIQRRLTPLGFALEFPAEPILKKLANVQHLLTPVRAVLPPHVRLLDVLAQLHPTPAVGGSPRAAAIAGIRQLEGFSRGLYAGAIGWINARGGGEFFVGLRSALVDGCTARLFAGAGIVAGSAPEKERAETELKFRAMQEALKL
ncbi:isochorismate synthase [Opitutus terrae]|uniref:isochorismate synthase n=1 Tax=Opitutus terrae (strain DSM 11246 / JCM 15787 / PB90-1) TaxID=452637 RepID=B1ZXD1_OPITP|nr:isochorismate synthase [Opitutus terrae]ACB76926.1 isochorismate synthase [Opitutus terrae PB90-1]